MLLFAHTGITLGMAWLVDNALARRSQSRIEDVGGREESLQSTLEKTETYNQGRMHVLGQTIDYRLVLIGSMLPDIIDKPLGTFIFQETISNGRVYAHTLLFTTMLLLLGFYLQRRGNIGMLVVALGSLAHLVLDSMWNAPSTLFWPILGWDFPRHDVSDWIPELIEGLGTNAWIYVSEIVGFLIIAGCAIHLLRSKGIIHFLSTGHFKLSGA